MSGNRNVPPERRTTYPFRASPDMKGSKVNSIYQRAVQSGLLNIWVAAVEVVGLVDLLKADDYLTIFAPADEAFAQLSGNRVDDLLTDFPSLLTTISYHIVPGKVMVNELAQLTSLRTLIKDDLHIEAGRGLFVNEARVVHPNIECRNGVIHVIDAVLSMKKRSKVRAGRYSNTGRHSRVQI